MAKAGDGAAFETLQLEFRRPIAAGIASAVRRFGPPANQYQEDLVQDAWLKLLDDGPRFLANIRSEHPNSCHKYLREMGFAVAFDFLRKKRWETQLSPDWPDPPIPPPDDRIHGDLIFGKVQRVLEDSASERDIAIFWRKYRDEWEPRQIAESGEFGLSKGGVETVLTKVVKRLREELGDRYVFQNLESRLRIEWAEQLLRCIESFAPSDHVLVDMLHWRDGMTPRQIANLGQLKFSEPQVRAILDRLRARAEAECGLQFPDDNEGVDGTRKQ